MIEHLTLGTEECQVEPHGRCWLLVWTSDPDIVEFNISGEVNMCDVLQGYFVVEMRILNFVIYLDNPTITITPHSVENITICSSIT